MAEFGGLHRFMNWPGPILTDSGGYQVFSLAKSRQITDHGAKFKSHIDGRVLELTPERAVKIQENLGSDIAMVLDECPPGDADAATLTAAMERSIRWAERCKAAHTRSDQAQFAIVQGGTDLSLRSRCAAELVAMDFPGYALGGFSRRRVAGVDARGVAGVRRDAAGRQAALPHGGGPAGSTW